MQAFLVPSWSHGSHLASSGPWLSTLWVVHPECCCLVVGLEPAGLDHCCSGSIHGPWPDPWHPNTSSSLSNYLQPAQIFITPSLNFLDIIYLKLKVITGSGRTHFIYVCLYQSNIKITRNNCRPTSQMCQFKHKTSHFGLKNMEEQRIQSHFSWQNDKDLDNHCRMSFWE